MSNYCQQSHFFAYLAEKADLLGVYDSVCVTLRSTYPALPWWKHFLLTHTENGTTSLNRLNIVVKYSSEMILKRVSFHTVTQKCADVFVPLCTCKVRMTTRIFSRCQPKKNIKKMIRVWRTWRSFLGKPHFFFCCWLWEKKWQKRRGEIKDQKVKSEKRDAL